MIDRQFSKNERHSPLAMSSEEKAVIIDRNIILRKATVIPEHDNPLYPATSGRCVKTQLWDVYTLVAS
ncbi:hypothetical protein TNCV_4211801 [Trichonephila clavipes]|nr:hypothetical protein TNCV_4211801 [Trichonephila clavipes]